MLDDNDIKNIVLIIRRGVGIGNEINKETTALFNKIKKSIDLDESLADNVKTVRDLFNEADIEADLIDKLVNVSKATIDSNAKFGLKPIKPTKKLINEALDVIMPGTNMSVNDLLKRTDGMIKTGIVNYIQQAKINGWTNKQLKDAITVSEGTYSRNIQTVINTAVSAVNAETKKRLYEENDDVIDRVLFLATLDNKTTDICKSLDGKAFKMEDAPTLPLHPNERSTLLPILIGEDVDEVKKDILPRPNVIPTKKDSDKLKGGTTYSQDYESWLRKQPKYYQEDILGEEATEEFRDGAKLTDVLKVSPITEEYLKKAI